MKMIFPRKKKKKKVRSLTLDKWDNESIRFLLSIGNAKANSVYEYKVPEGVVRATPECSQEIRENWIRSKYVQKKFIPKPPSENFDASKELWNKAANEEGGNTIMTCYLLLVVNKIKIKKVKWK